MILGWLLILVGILGLVLPGIQGVLTLMLGVACISLVDPRALRLMRPLFKKWPKGWRMLLKLRRKMHRWLAKKPDAEGDVEADVETEAKDVAPDH